MGDALFIPSNAPSYQCLSTDISGSTVPKASYRGANIYFTDTQLWYRVKDDLTLVPLVQNVTLSGSTNSTISTNQDVVADSDNSFSGSLASSASFVGTSHSTLNIVGIQVSLYSTQNMTVWIEQSPDGTNWDISDSYNYHTNDTGFGITVQAINSYYRVIIKNVGVDTATAVRLQTALCPIVEAVPRSLTPHGNFKVAIKEFEDKYGFGVENTPNDEMRVITPYRLVGSLFSGSALDANYWTAGSGSGSIVIGNGQAILTTGSDTNGSSAIQSVRSARYVGGSSNRARFVLRMPDTGVANNTRRWGAFNTTSGAFFEISGSTPKVVTRKNSVDTPVLNGSFNGDYGTKVNLTDFTTVKTYEIYWNNSKVYFAISGALVHTVNASDTTWTDNVSLPLRVENLNSGSVVTNTNLHVRNAIISRLGSALSQPTSNYTSGQTAGKLLKNGAGNLHSVIVGSQASTSVVTLYDGLTTGGNVLFSYTYTQGTQANNQPFALDFKGIPFSTGLLLVIATANSNVTVIYE